MSDSKPTGPARFTQDQPAQPNSRRRFLQTGMTGVAAAVVAGSGLTMIDSQPAMAENPENPDAALKTLMDGNGRFVSGRLTACKQDLKALRRELANKQEPFAAVLTCADSRAPVALLFDQSIGQIFVTRVAGNMITPEIIASLEYGVAVLGTKVILVLGHSDCGAIKAAIAHSTVPGQISSLYPHLQPAVDKAGPDVKATTKTNAQIQAKLLSESSTVVSAAIKDNKLKMVAGYYDIGSGAVTVLD